MNSLFQTCAAGKRGMLQQTYTRARALVSCGDTQSRRHGGRLREEIISRVKRGRSNRTSRIPMIDKDKTAAFFVRWDATHDSYRITHKKYGDILFHLSSFKTSHSL